MLLKQHKTEKCLIRHDVAASTLPCILLQYFRISNLVLCPTTDHCIRVATGMTTSLKRVTKLAELTKQCKCLHRSKCTSCTTTRLRKWQLRWNTSTVQFAKTRPKSWFVLGQATVQNDVSALCILHFRPTINIYLSCFLTKCHESQHNKMWHASHVFLV